MTDPAAERPSLRGRLLVGVTRLIAALPELPLIAAAESVGELSLRRTEYRELEFAVELVAGDHFYAVAENYVAGFVVGSIDLHWT